MREERPANLVIGLTGSLGSGCSTLAEALEARGFRYVSLSEPIKQEFKELEKRNEPINELWEAVGVDYRKQLQDIGNRHRAERLDYWVRKALDGLELEPDEKLVVDNIRNPGEVTALRDRYPLFFLVAVYADRETRWRRVQEDYEQNERTFQRDDRRDHGEDEPHGQQVQQCVDGADYVVVNTQELVSRQRRLDELHRRISDAVELMQGKPARDPYPHEVHMATAYALSHASKCLKRHVGAVIVDTNNLVISAGYNENPVGMRPCKMLYRSCYKDNMMHDRLERMGSIVCPRCGEKDRKLDDPWKCSRCDANLKLIFFPSRNIEHCTAIHAEERAIRSLGARNAEGAKLYSTTFPCFQCARYVKDVGIKEVVYVEAYPDGEAVEYLEHSSITLTPFEGFKARAFNLVFRQIE